MEIRVKHIINNPHAIYFNGELIGVITNPDPVGNLFQIAEALSPDDPEMVQVVMAGASKPEIEALVERFPVNLRTKVWQIETPLENDGNSPPDYPIYNEDGTEVICHTVVPTADQTKAAVSASTGISEDLIDVEIVSTVEQMRFDTGYVVKTDISNMG
jgi:hypothetical protein